MSRVQGALGQAIRILKHDMDSHQLLRSLLVSQPGTVRSPALAQKTATPTTEAPSK